MGPAHRRRDLQQPGPRAGEVRGRRPDLPDERWNRLPQRRARARRIPGNATTPGGNTSYARSGNVVDSQPRTHQQPGRRPDRGQPGRVAAAGPNATPDESGTLFIPNEATDVGLSAPFNSWFTLFGQFFDHGLDLVNKGGAGTVFMPLDPSDPLYNPATPGQNFMVVTRATGSPGSTTNQTATFVDQSQTYTSHPSHQVFLREYDEDADGKPVSNGKMLEGTLDDGTRDGMATWASAKEQARTLLGIELDDQDVLNLPLLATDPYGKFLPGANGFPQLILPGNVRLEGNPDAPVDASQAVRTGHAFLDDIAHLAVPFGDHDHNPATARQPLGPDPLAVAGDDDGSPATYDDELLAEHFVAGDGRVNENIGLTAVHHIFHAEHNRLAADPSRPGAARRQQTSRTSSSTRTRPASPTGRSHPASGTGSGSSRPPASSPRWSTSTSRSRSSSARSSRWSTSSVKVARVTTRPSTRRSARSSPTRSTASGTRC